MTRRGSRHRFGSRVGVALLLASMLHGAGARADEPRQVFLGAPYAEATAAASCFEVLDVVGSCPERVATADAATGRFELRLTQHTRDAGRSVGLVTGVAAATLIARHARPEPAGALLVVATVAVDDVLSKVEAGILSPLGRATAEVLVDARSDACPDCSIASSRVVSSAGAPFDAPGTVSVLAVMSNPTGEAIPAGTIEVAVTIAARAQVVGVGRARSHIAGTLTRSEVAAPSAERLLVPPYGSAAAERACSGSPGVTFACRSAAARSTGRIEMDLEVISPVAGTAPGSGTASGVASVRLDDAPSEPVRARIYVVRLAVGSADVHVQSPTPLIGGATAWIASEAVITGPCDACARGAGAGIVDLGRPFRLDEEIPLVVWTREDADATAARGETIELRVDGLSWLDDSAGIAIATLRSTLGSVRAIEIA